MNERSSKAVTLSLTHSKFTVHCSLFAVSQSVAASSQRTHSHSLTVTHSQSLTHSHSLTVTHSLREGGWLVGQSVSGQSAVSQSVSQSVSESE